MWLRCDTRGVFLCAHSSCQTGRPGNHVSKSGQRKCGKLPGRAAVLLRAGDESSVNDKGGQPRIKSGQRKRCTLQGAQAPVCCCLLGHGLCKPAFPPKGHPASHYTCMDNVREAMSAWACQEKRYMNNFSVLELLSAVSWRI